jgi:hypothetical protein
MSSPRGLNGEPRRRWTSGSCTRTHRRAPAPFIGARAVGEKSRPLRTSATGVKVWAGEVVLSARRSAAMRLAGQRGDRGRVARAGWGREAVGAPSNAPTRAAWFPWRLGVRAGPTVGSAVAAHGLASDVAWHASERWVPETFSSSPV